MKMFKHLAVAVMAAGVVFVTATTADPEDWEPEPGVRLDAPPPPGPRLSDSTYACYEKELLEELILAAERRDERQHQYLMSIGCFPIAPMEYSLIEKHGSIAKVRVWDSERKKGGLIFWVWPAPTE